MSTDASVMMPGAGMLPADPNAGCAVLPPASLDPNATAAAVVPPESADPDNGTEPVTVAPPDEPAVAPTLDPTIGPAPGGRVLDLFRRKLWDLRRELIAADLDVEKKSQALKEAKGWREELFRRIVQTIDEEKGQPSLPFTDPDSPDGPPATAPDDGSWREADIRGALRGLTVGVYEKLEEAELTTVGKLSDYLQKCHLTDIAGIGQVKADMIEQALEDFWKRRNVELSAPKATIGPDDRAGD